MNYPKPTDHVKPDANGKWRVQGRYIARSAEKQKSQRAKLTAAIKAGTATAADLKAYNLAADIVLAETAAERSQRNQVKRGDCAVDRRTIKRATSVRIWSGWL